MMLDQKDIAIIQDMLDSMASSIESSIESSIGMRIKKTEDSILEKVERYRNELQEQIEKNRRELQEQAEKTRNELQEQIRTLDLSIERVDERLKKTEILISDAMRRHTNESVQRFEKVERNMDHMSQQLDLLIQKMNNINRIISIVENMQKETEGHREKIEKPEQETA